MRNNDVGGNQVRVIFEDSMSRLGLDKVSSIGGCKRSFGRLQNNDTMLDSILTIRSCFKSDLGTP